MILYSGGSSEDGGSAPSESGVGSALVLKKGPWTAAEDEILAAYVREHGEGNWNAVQKNTGLARCGKSCRLRWANHLRPNLKKGAFTPEEERLIIQLHAQLGNKWARMAAQLPGRTDNEIKNYWNTRLKRLQRQGLPLYPPDIIPNHQIQSHRHHQHIYLPPQSQPNTPSSSTMAAAAAATSSSSFTFQTTTTSPLLRPLSPTPCHTPTTPQTPSRPSSTPPPPLSPTLSSPCQYSTLPLFTLPKSPTLHHDTNAFTFPRPPPLLQPLSMCAKRFNTAHCGNNSKVTCSSGMSGPGFSPSPLPLAKSSYASFLTQPYSSPATPTAATSKRNINESVALLVSSSPSSSPIHSFSLNPSSPYHSSSSPNHHMFHTHFTPLSLQSNEPVYSMKPELPSNQMSHSTSLGRVYDVTNLTDNEKHHHHQNLDADLDRRSSCELLENVLNQAESLDGDGRAPKRRQLMVFPDENNNVLSSFGHCGTSNGICSPQGQKQREDESLQMNVMQEDIAKLLDWGSDSGEISNGHSSVVTDDNLVLDVHQFASLFPVDASAAPNDDHDKNTTSCSWDNLSRIC